MSVFDDLRKRWFVTSLCAAAALFFVGGLAFSTMSYVRVMDAREHIVLVNADEDAEILGNGTLLITFSIELKNPSKLDLSVATLSWNVKLDVSMIGSDQFLPLGNAYKGPTEYLFIKAGSTTEFHYSTYVTDADVFSVIDDYIAYQSSAGQDYTPETIPYAHDFRFWAWLGEYRHDYQYYGELYLNDMVRIDRYYQDGEYL